MLFRSAEHQDEVIDENGYLTIDQAGLDQDGTDIETIHGDQVLAVDTANGLTITGRGKRGAVYRPRQAVCLETQFFPDSPNHPEWGDILLRPGRRYDYTTEFRFTHI